VWRASLPVLVGVLGIGLAAFSLLLPGKPPQSAPTAPVRTVTATTPVEVSKAPAPTPSPEPLPPRVDCTQVPCVALTFDDGPSAYSEALLDKLDELGVKVTFFNTGQNTANRPESVKRQVESGHAVGGHSWNHVQLTTISPADACADANRTADAIKQASGVETYLVRPPYGSWNDAMLAACSDKTFILWDVDTEDWRTHDAAQIRDHAVGDSRAGSIVLMHDTVAESIEALPSIVAGLKERGFELVTVPELWNEPIAPGQSFYNGPRAG
jgi:peptidoglycan/xylan/chitin deacetylase (PgdA/CDA1 family)